MATDIIVRVDPKTLLVGPNVRKDVVLGKEFVASIKQHGVRVPISAQETDEGKYEVIDGQRRTLAAVDAGLDQVPVVVIEREEAAARIVDQLIVNEHRAGISDADQVAAIKELSLFDMPAQTIARKVGIPKAVVETAIAVGSSERAVAAMRGDNPVSFESATVLAEFEGDEEAQADLAEKAAKGYYLEHIAQDWRDKRGLERAAEQIKERGLTLIERPSYNQSDPIEVRELFLDAKRTKRLSDLPDAELAELAGDGLCGFPTFVGYGSEREYVIGYAVKGWKDRGLFAVEWRTQGSAKSTTPEEAEKLKAERRLARENTKAWASATAVRVEFLRGLVGRRTPPKGWAEFVAPRMVTADPVGSGHWKMVATLLQLETKDTYSFRSSVEAYLAGKPTAAPQVLVAAAAASFEAMYEFDRKGWQSEKTPAYLRQLQEWGYELAELEQSLVKKPRPRKAAA